MGNYSKSFGNDVLFWYFWKAHRKISWFETFLNSFEYDDKMKGIELTWWIASSVIFYTRTQSIKEAELTSFLALNYIYVVIENFSLFLSETNFQLFWFRNICVYDSRNLLYRDCMQFAQYAVVDFSFFLKLGFLNFPKNIGWKQLRIHFVLVHISRINYV